MISHNAKIEEKLFLISRRSVMLAYPNYQERVDRFLTCFKKITSSGIAMRLADPDDPQDNIRAVRAATEQRAWYSVAALHIQYSAGVAIDELNTFFPEVVHYWEEYAKYDKAYDESPVAGGRKVPHLDLFDKDYWRAIRLTSFGILLGHGELLPRVAALWDYENDDMDGLLERLVAPFVPGRDAPPDECTRHLPYFKLLKVFSAEPDKRPELMAKYMKDWYEASRREPYYEGHTPGGQHSFLGYWSFEAAAVTYVLDIDDSSYRDHEFYPRDLIDFARSLPRPVELGGESAQIKLRCEANHPCPKTGYWWTPAKENSRTHFKQGETMPDFPESSYGATIWQWDLNQTDQ